MEAVKAIVWFIALMSSAQFVFWIGGISGIASFFPEGKRWWMAPARLASLAMFAFLVLHHPFGGQA